MKTKTWIWIAVLAALVLAGLAAAAWVRQRGEGAVARITVDGEVVERIDLTKVREARELVIETRYGRNTVYIEPGAISVTEADCPDGICVRMGKLTTEGGMPIVCMPHRLMIEIEDDGIDG